MTRGAKEEEAIRKTNDRAADRRLKTIKKSRVGG